MDNAEAEALRESLIPTGQRQYGTDIQHVKPNHVVRYRWAAERMKPDWLVLDAACGIGYGTALLAGDQARAHGLEVELDVVRLATHYYGGDRCTFECAELHTWSAYARGVYDMVVSFETIEHLVMPELFLASAWEALKPGGTLIFSTPNVLVSPHRLEGNPFHLRHYTSDQCCRLAELAGFVVDSVCSQVGGITDSRIVANDDGGRFWVIEATRDNIAGDSYRRREELRAELPRRYHEAFIQRCQTIRSLRT